jgi:hypothetical protein
MSSSPRRPPAPRKFVLSEKPLPVYASTRDALFRDVRVLRADRVRLQTEVRNLTRRVRELEAGEVELRRAMNEVTPKRARR